MLNSNPPQVNGAPIPRATLSARKRRGLALEGGGAKGAYAFGVLRAFSDKGVEFDAVSGASIGALNGLLFAIGELSEGERIWTELTPGSVLALRRPLMIVLPLSLLHHLSVRFVDWRAKHPLGHYTLQLITLATLSIILMFATALSLGFIEFILAVLRQGWTANLAGFGGLLPAVKQTPPHVVIGIGGLAIVITATYLVARLMVKAGPSVFDLGPLRHRLGEIVSKAEFRIPAFVSLSKRCEILDPDNLEWYRFDLASDAPPILEAVPAVRYVPEYVRIDDLDPATLLDTVLTSAALPYGIISGKGGKVDGGLADNLPVFPLMQGSQACDEIVVIRLRPYPTRRSRQDRLALTDYWTRTDRLIRLAKLTRSEAISLAPYHRGCTGPVRPDSPVIPARVPTKMPQRVIVVAPRRRLGRFLMGTLNLRKKYARRLMDEGYEDGLRLVARYWPQLKPSG